MPRNERRAAARAFRYDVGPVGPAEMRAVAEEIPVEIAFGGVPFAVMMATPSDLEDFVYGFALTEGVIERASDILAVEISIGKAEARVSVSLQGPAMSAHLARRRALAGRTGCGLCGLEDFSQLRPIPARARAPRKIAPPAIGAAVKNIDAHQPLNQLTHAAHAAAWCGRDGAIRLAREDVGRHNALDKLVGALIREDADADDGFILITSRCSYEMVVKSARFGARTLVAVSAPTSFALEIAETAGIELVAVARADHALSFVASDAESGGAA